MREIVVETAGNDAFEALGWAVRKCLYAGRRGSPDRWNLKNEFAVLVEYKRPGEGPTPIQANEHKRLRKSGVRVYVIDRVATAEALPVYLDGKFGMSPMAREWAVARQVLIDFHVIRAA